MNIQPIQILPSIGVLAIMGVYAVGGSGARTAPPQSLPITHGVAAGDVTAESAVIWSRTNQEAIMHVAVRACGALQHYAIPVSAHSGYTGKIFVGG